MERLIRYVCLVVCVSVLAACAGVTALPAASPSPTLTAEWMPEECLCPCAAKIWADAWVDDDADGQRDPEEKPLQGVSFRVEWYTLACETGGSSQHQVVSMVSDATGSAGTTVTGCNCDSVDVYAEVPAGYKLTTADRCQEGCAFGFVRRDAGSTD